MSTSVLRRYTPPTCTLKIAATGSALSRWTDRTVMKNLRFQLSFDDPRRSPDDLVELAGDRIQLEALNDAVSDYVQQLLMDHCSAVQLPLAPSNDLAGSADLSSAQDSSKPGIYLQPKGLLTHELYLGTLGTPETAVVPLSVTQLFDLSNALAEYAAESLALPTANRPAWLQPSNGWLRMAAVMVLALGTTGSIVKFAMDITAPVTQSVASDQELGSPAPLPTVPVPAGAAPPLAVPTVPSSDTIPLPPPSGVFKQPGVAPGTAFNPSLVPPAAGTRVLGSTQDGQVPVPTGVPAPPTVRPDQIASAQQVPSGDRQPASAALEADSAAGTAATATLRPSQPSAASAPTATAPSATARSGNLDSIPQVAEVRTFFLSRWQPPEALNRTLEYRLQVAPDGTIQRVIPLGDQAGNYLDRTGMPLIGEPFVSPILSGQRALIRLVLYPDGRVQTLLEELN